MEDFSIRTVPTFIDGVFLAANSVRDAMLVFRGGACVYEHIIQTFEDHDHSNNFISLDGKGRLIVTFTDSAAVTMGAAKETEELLREGIEKLKPGAVILAELSMITLAGEDIRNLARSLSERYGLPVIPAASRYLSRDYTDAYESILCGAASSLRDGCFTGMDNGVAGIIGLFYERGEGDWEGNVAEIERIVKSIGLEPCPVWFSGSGFRDLEKIGRAGLLAALPYGGKAAGIISGKSGAAVVNLDLPVGIEGTAEWARKIATAAGKKDECERFIKNEIDYIIPRLDRVVLRSLAGSRAAVIAGRDWLKVIPEFFENELGIEVPVRIARQRYPLNAGASGAGDAVRDYDPGVKSVNALVEKELRSGGIDLIVGSSWERSVLAGGLRDIPYFEFGYPCKSAHYLKPAPFLGFTGVLTWAERLAEIIGSKKE